MSVVAAAVVTGAKVPEKAAPVVAKVADAAAGGDAAPTTAPTTTPVGTCEALLHRDAVIDFVHCSCQCPCWRSTQRCMKKVMGWPSSCSIWETVFMILTGYALFASDIQGAFCPVSFDTFFVVMTLLCLFMFMLELTMMSVASTRDEPYFLMFFFWLDMVAALSLLADIPWLTNALLGELTMARAGRAARAGTRAGRVVRVLRVLRLIRIVRLLKMFRRKSDDDEEEEDAGEEKKPTADGLSKKITELDTVKQIIAVLTMLFILPLLEAEVTDNGPAVLMQTITKLAAHADGSRYCTAIHDTVTELNTFTPPSRSWIQDWLAPPENTMAFPIRYLEIFAGASRTNHVCYNSTVVIDHGVSDLRKNELKKMWQPDAALTFEAKNVAVRIMVDNRAGEREGHVFNMMVTCFVIFILGGMAMISQKVGGILAKAITQPLANIATPVAALADMQLKDIKHMNMDSMKEMVAGDDDEDDDIAIISTKDSWMKCQGRRQCTLCCKCSLVVQEIRQLVYTFIKLKITIENIGLFIPVEVLQKSIVSGERITPKLEQRDASLMLCKFRDFEGMVAALSPNEMAIKIEEFHNAIATVLERDTSEEKGVILDFIGDAVLAGWNVSEKDDAEAEEEAGTDEAFGERALRTVELGFRIQDAMEELRNRWSEQVFASHVTDAQTEEWKKQCSALAQLRIGVHACRGAEGLIGNCGSDSRMKFMTLGAGVNLTSRLQFLNDYYGTLILVSGQTVDAGVVDAATGETPVSRQFITRPVDVLRVNGFEKGVTIYEVMDRKTNPAVKAVAELHTAAFEKFLARNWDAAITEFTQVIKQHLRTGYRDRVAALLIQRCKVMKAKSPPASWDGAAEW